MNPSLQAILDMPSNQIDRVTKPLPTGWYVATVEGQHDTGTASTGNDFWVFNMRIVDAYKDVDEEALSEYLTGLDGSEKVLSDVRVKNTYYITQPAIPRLLIFLDHLEGLRPNDTQKQKAAIPQRVAETNGKTCLIHIKHRPWKSGEGISADIDQTMIYDDE